MPNRRRRFPVAQTLLDNRQPNRRIELHAVHPPPLATIRQGTMSGAFLRRRDRTARTPRVEHYWAAVSTMLRLPDFVRAVSGGGAPAASSSNEPKRLRGRRYAFPP